VVGKVERTFGGKDERERLDDILEGKGGALGNSLRGEDGKSVG